MKTSEIGQAFFFAELALSAKNIKFLLSYYSLQEIIIIIEDYRVNTNFKFNKFNVILNF